ncbi:MAG TPA: formylglycine-generating enzyme family protein [bacterium]|nr:formylglycine-generating enzyme family protein [bacterium]
MKKLLISLIFVLLFFVGSCGGDDTGDTGNTGNPDTGAMVSVPAGSFQMGCNEAVDDQCDSDESPYHEMTLSAYKIDKYEVTAGEYQKCVDAGDCNNSNESEPHYYTTTDDPSCNLGATGKGDHPMQCVSWYGAKAYCEWKGLRLPTEAEWEKAARGTEGAKYPWGNEPEVSCEYAIMAPYIAETDEYDNGCGTDSTWVVGSKEKGKSPYGAYDMIGNVWEWTNDWYGETYYETTPSENPAGPESGGNRVLRGGSWSNSSDYNLLRASSRASTTPDSWNTYYGFRCAK